MDIRMMVKGIVCVVLFFVISCVIDIFYGEGHE
jgi:hypothetical protein